MVEVGVVQEPRGLRDLHPRGSRLDEEQHVLALVRRRNDVDAGVALTRDEPLLSIDHPVVTVAVGRRCQCREVGAGTRFGQRPRLPVLAAHDRQHVLLGLHGGEKLEELAGTPVYDREPEPVCRLSGFLLERDLSEHREIAASESGRHVEHREAGSTRFRAQIVDLGRVDRIALCDSQLDRVDLFSDEEADLPLQLGDVLG